VCAYTHTYTHIHSHPHYKSRRHRQHPYLSFCQKIAPHAKPAHLMRLWPSHQYVLGEISLTHSEQTLGLQSSQRFKACPADPNDTIFGLYFPTPATDSQVQADPSLKEKAWHLTWMPLAFLDSLRPQRQPTHFTEICARSVRGSRAHL